MERERYFSIFPSVLNSLPATGTISYLIFTIIKLCLANATNNFKWLKITHICVISDQTLANLDVTWFNTHFIPNNYNNITWALIK